MILRINLKISIIIIAVANSSLSQDTLGVPLEFSTIQFTSHNSNKGDIVLVGNGIYYVKLVWPDVKH